MRRLSAGDFARMATAIIQGLGRYNARDGAAQAGEVAAAIAAKEPFNIPPVCVEIFVCG